MNMARKGRAVVDCRCPHASGPEDQLDDDDDAL